MSHSNCQTCRHAQIRGGNMITCRFPVPIYITQHKNMRGLLWYEGRYSDKDSYLCNCYQQGQMSPEMTKRVRQYDHAMPLEDYKEAII